MELPEARDGEDALKERVPWGNGSEEQGECRVNVRARMLEQLGGKVHPRWRRGCGGRFSGYGGGGRGGILNGRYKVGKEAGC